MTITDYFDPEQISHIRAYQHLKDRGQWPEGFVPEDCEFVVGWQFDLAFKIANTWVEQMLLAHEGVDVGC